MTEKQSRLPAPDNRQYLHIKVEYAMRFPRLSAEIRRNGKSYRMRLKQLMMSGLIRVDEIARDYQWWYKAEVPFDMRTTPPRPFLSSTLLNDGPGRRHTTNPFPVPGIRAVTHGTGPAGQATVLLRGQMNSSGRPGLRYRKRRI